MSVGVVIVCLMSGTTQDDQPRSSHPMSSMARRLPSDVTNTAAATRSRFRYQDECVALVMLQHLGSSDLDGILVEHSTDAILIYGGRPVELVSIKHREVDRVDDSGWSLDALKKQDVLAGLYRQWCNVGKSCGLAFWTNAGFVRNMRELRNVLVNNAMPSPDLAQRIAKILDTSLDEARDFLRVLTTPPEPLPRRKEITAQGIRQTELLLRRYRTDAVRFAEHCYRALIEEIAVASTDVPESERRIPLPITGTLAEFLRQRKEREIEQRYFNAVETLDSILREFDAKSAQEIPNLDQYGWVADPHFTGRVEHLRQLETLLAPGNPHEVEPVVVHGLTGCGKTSLATEFAAKHSDVLRPVFISTETRVALLHNLARLAGQEHDETTETGITAAGGPVTPPLPGNSGTLLILDGVTDADTIRGIIPRQSLCRVLITSTVKHLDQGYMHLELDSWRPEESEQYLRVSLSDASENDRRQMANALYHHPLALVQAANHCRLMDRSVPEFLERLANEPINTLDMGEASGHQRSIIQAIKFNVASVSERDPLAKDLLYVLAHLGTDPLPLSLFKQRLAIAMVASPSQLIPTPPSSRWRKWIGRLRPEPPQSQEVKWHDADAFRILKELVNPASRNRAVNVLLKSSLVSIRGGGLVLHPLTALVLRNLSSNLLRWLEIGFGIVITGGKIESLDDNDRADELLGHLLVLTATALENHFNGPAVFVSCHHLARRLGALGQLKQENNRQQDALYFGQIAVELSTEAASTDRNAALMVIIARETLAAIYFWLGETDLAIHYHKENLAACLDISHFDLYIRTLRMLAEVACWRGRRELAEGILDKIENELDTSPLDADAHLVVSHIKVMILRLLGRIEEAISINRWALDQKSSREKIPQGICEMLLRDAVQLARDTDNFTDLAHYQNSLLNLEQSKVKPGRRADTRLIDTIRAAADAAIDSGDLDHSKRLIDQAYTLTMDEFDEQSEVYATVLATRGRLFLHLGRIHDSRHDLERSEQFFRDNPELSEGSLPAVLLHLAHITNIEGEKGKALQIAREAYEIDRKTYGEDHPETKKDANIIQLIKDSTGLPHFYREQQ